MPSKQPNHVDATFYAVIVPKWQTWLIDAQNRPILEGAKVERITQTRPAGKMPAGAVITRLTIRLDAGALLPLQPEAVVHVTAGQAETILVDAADPRDDVDEP